MDDGWEAEANTKRKTRGHWKDNVSIYESISTGKCVLSSGSPDYIGPIHTETLAEAKALATMKEPKT